MTGHIVKCDRVEHAVVYELRYTEDEFSADARWTHLVAQTATTFYLTRLTPTKYIWIQIRTINTKGPSDWSDPLPLYGSLIGQTHKLHTVSPCQKRQGLFFV